MMSSKSEPSVYYVLGWEQPNSKVAILCRGSSGPALCRTWKDTVKLRTNLLNDPRAKRNSQSSEIIRSLRIYRLSPQQPLIWKPGDLWVYVDARMLECVED
jgi:hypothetical protein